MRSIIAVCGLLMGFAFPLSAAEVCVVCDAPAKTYRCSVEGLPEGKNAAIEAEVRAHACEKVLVKLEHHGNCRSIPDAKTCDGKSRTITLTDYQRAIAGDVETTYEPGAFERAKQGMQSAWTCVASLFSDC
jgi:hypothetical protein